MKELIGRVVQAVYLNEDEVTFVTDEGILRYEVYGDCCSDSYFYDFIGVGKLLGRAVVDVTEIGVTQRPHDNRYQEVTECYGVAFTTDDPLFGLLTSVLSFRNDSNGYYAGWYAGPVEVDEAGLVEDGRVFADVLETSPRGDTL